MNPSDVTAEPFRNPLRLLPATALTLGLLCFSPVSAAQGDAAAEDINAQSDADQGVTFIEPTRDADHLFPADSSQADDDEANNNSPEAEPNNEARGDTNGHEAASAVEAAGHSATTAAPADADQTADAATAFANPTALPGLKTLPRFAELAHAGRFDDLLVSIRSDTLASAEARDLGLIDDLERYRDNAAARKAQRRADFDAAMAEARRLLEEEEDLDEAIVSVIEAHSLSEEPEVFLHDPFVKKLVKKMEIAAKQAEVDRDWLEASLRYSKLDLLFEDDRKYLDDVRRIGRHIRALNVYNPAYLDRKVRERNERLGKPNDDPGELERDDWRTRLSGIPEGGDVVRRVMEQAKRSHIGNHDFDPLITGAVEAMLVLLDTAEGVGETFPSLNDPAASSEFRAELVRIRQEINTRSDALGKHETASLIDRVFAANQRTLRLPERVVAYELTEGALGELDDFSSMYWPEDIDHLRRSTSGNFPGVGIQIQRVDNRIVVVSPLPGTPAYEAGVLAGDVIATVDGRSASPWSLSKAVREITGPEGTRVTLGIRREGVAEIIEIPVERRRIGIESVKGWAHTADGGWDYWLDRDAGIGYVRLTQFMPQTIDGLNDAIRDLREAGPLNGVVLDLRFNPGGLLTSAIEVVNRFVDGGDLLYTVDQEGQRNNFWRAQSGRTLRDLDLVVLINRGSASASEIVAGVLQDHERAAVVGTRSFGKGSVQNVFWHPAPPRRPVWGLKVTTEYYQLPNGAIIHRTDDANDWGITPDLVVEPSNQLVVWALDLRQELDVIRNNAGQLRLRSDNPAVRLAGLEPVDPDDEDAAEKVVVEGIEASALLELGLDPQLETALLLLKTRALTRDVVVARAAQAAVKRVTPSDTP